MKGLETFEIKSLEGYIKGKKAYEKVFPKFYDSVAERVVGALRSKYPEIEADVGPRDIVRAMKKFPLKGEKVPLDWVAFGFYGLDLYDFHIGVILLMEDWPVKYHIGLHVMENTWTLVQKDVESINWKKEVGPGSNYVFADSVREHRFVDPIRDLNLSDLEGEVRHVSERVVRYYEASAPIAERWVKSIRK